MHSSINSAGGAVRAFRAVVQPMAATVRRAQQLNLAIHNEIIIDLFAGGGGASSGTEEALGRRVDIAINHNPAALSMHQANHPETKHYCEDVRDVDPRIVADGRRVGYLHLSPDCRHHSQAAGGQPRSKEIRGLSWQAKKFGGTVAPRVITLENVVQIKKWGPLIAKRDKATGRVLKLDGKRKTVAAPGERVPVEQQFLIPDPKRAGQTWRRLVSNLQHLGYTVENRTLRAADYGAPTTRERLFMVARRDGRPIVWPEPSHAKNPGPGQRKWRAAAECIDWSIPCPSIFLSKAEAKKCHVKRPLADATLTRIAKGIRKYVLDNANPFIVPLTHQGADRVHDINDPLRTVTGAHRGELALVDPIIVPIAHYNGRDTVHSSQDPLKTITAATKGGGHAVATAYLAQMNGGFNTTPGHDLDSPMTTITNTGSKQQMVAAFLANYHTDTHDRCRDLRDPAATITTENRLAQVEVTLSPEAEEGALRVSAFMMKYYGTGGQMNGADEPMATVTTKDRLALVTVILKGTPYVIVDIGLRMLTPRELYLAQGFRPDYIIDRGHDGRKFSKSDQVHMCGNSVSPVMQEAIVSANCPDLSIRRAA